MGEKSINVVKLRCWPVRLVSTTRSVLVSCPAFAASRRMNSEGFRINPMPVSGGKASKHVAAVCGQRQNWVHKGRGH